MANQGWIKLYRRFLTDGSLRNHKLGIFKIYCLLKVSHKTHKVDVGNRRVKIDPGEFIFGRQKASKETGLSERTIRTCLKTLESDRFLTIKSTNKYSIISIINWDSYQSEPFMERPAERPISDQQATTYKNGKKGKKNTYSAKFLLLWESYPSAGRVDKGKAFKAYEGKVLTIEDEEGVVKALENYKQHLAAPENKDWKRPKNIATFLNSWRDWLEVETKEKVEVFL